MKTGSRHHATARHLQSTATIADEATQAKLAALFPRLASTHDGEVIATVQAIRRTLERAGKDLHDLAALFSVEDEEEVIEDVQDALTPEATELLRMAEWLRDGARLYGRNQPLFVRNVIDLLRAGKRMSRGQKKYLRDLFVTHGGEVRQ